MTFFDDLRSAHPVKVGDYYKGQKVIQTHYRGLECIPCVVLEDYSEHELRGSDDEGLCPEEER